VFPKACIIIFVVTEELRNFTVHSEHRISACAGQFL